MWKSRQRNIRKNKIKEITVDDQFATEFDQLASRLTKCHIANPATYYNKSRHPLPSIFKMHWLIYARLKAKRHKLKKATLRTKREKLGKTAGNHEGSKAAPAEASNTAKDYRQHPIGSHKSDDAKNSSGTLSKSENLFQYALHNSSQQLGFSSFLGGHESKSLMPEGHKDKNQPKKTGKG